MRIEITLADGSALAFAGLSDPVVERFMLVGDTLPDLADDVVLHLEVGQTSVALRAGAIARIETRTDGTKTLFQQVLRD